MESRGADKRGRNSVARISLLTTARARQTFGRGATGGLQMKARLARSDRRDEGENGVPV